MLSRAIHIVAIRDGQIAVLLALLNELPDADSIEDIREWIRGALSQLGADCEQRDETGHQCGACAWCEAWARN